MDIRPGGEPVKSQGKSALVLAVIAIALVLFLAYGYVTTVRRLEKEVAALRQQTEVFGRKLERAQELSQRLARQASQAALNAQAAAQQRDVAKQAQSISDAQAQLARQQAATAQQNAEQARQQAATAQQNAEEARQRTEQYRQDREEQLAQLRQTLGKIAETRRTAMGLVMTLDSKSIRFDFDQAKIKPKYRDILNRVAGILMTLNGYTIAIYGYSDDVGTQTYNLELSRRRAQAVRDFLVKAGISPKIITTKGFGKSDPRVPGHTEEARAANRRVEIAIVDSKVVYEPN